jgi:cell division protein FtsB
MNQNLILTIIELFISIVIEGIILSMVFNYIANRQSEKQEQKLQKEMNNIETQNKFIFTQLTESIQQAKQEIISEIKERT